MLPATDQSYLTERAPGHRVSLEGGMIAVLIPSFALPAGLNLSEADLLLRLSPGYPDVAPDMWWFSPAVARKDGHTIPATDVQEHHLGRLWQRWSRHFNPGQWRAGLDSLESYTALVRKELRTAARGVAA
jgi:hypothetical protein